MKTELKNGSFWNYARRILEKNTSTTPATISQNLLEGQAFFHLTRLKIPSTAHWKTWQREDGL